MYFVVVYSRRFRNANVGKVSDFTKHFSIFFTLPNISSWLLVVVIVFAYTGRIELPNVFRYMKPHGLSV